MKIKKVIGICSGMQIMFNSSSEGNELVQIYLMKIRNFQINQILI